MTEEEMREKYKTSGSYLNGKYYKDHYRENHYHLKGVYIGDSSGLKLLFRNGNWFVAKTRGSSAYTGRGGRTYVSPEYFVCEFSKGKYKYMGKDEYTEEDIIKFHFSADAERATWRTIQRDFIEYAKGKE